ncbi:MAG TPA: ATP-binding protein [Syntrophorhabdaceae bacterium]|nr:ATP-binding protein [Syntrophorhabdaceae bacterium]HQM82935.1 ATP-binding protein [Syntrophorhabdaceae bacterium]
MMDEIASHIMDIVANSLTARAKNISVVIERCVDGQLLVLDIKDDGVGMDNEMAMKVQDPFFSTKTGRKVGLGIPLLKGTAETTGGDFCLTSEPGRGTEIRATFNADHPDLPPLGNLKDTILVLAVGNPEVNFLFRYKNGDKEFLLDTAEVKDLLGGVPINHPEVISFLSKYLDEHL